MNEQNANNENETAFDGRATYCPEDNKLRLYVGRVPRDEYLKLRAEGWVALHKQRDSGGGDFAATWTPERRDTALDYAGIIEDEDMRPAERAADRAERFGVYRDKRTDEATGRADAYEAGPSVHGFQSQARAERAAARHDRIAGRAVDAWSKAEYWQRRTAGVISHALHVAGAGVRMGRIKTLETELRGLLARWEGQEMTERAKDWKTHLELRLAYENQMLEAQGGRAGVVEMEVGGTWLGGVIAKINKSNVTGRVVSVHVITAAVSGWHYRVSNEPGTPFALAQFETERAKPESYQPPTDESRAKLAEFEAVKKAAAAKRKAEVAPCPLVNPTDEDAERLQSIWNERAKARRASSANCYGDFVPSVVLRLTQAQYSEYSKGVHARLETRELCGNGQLVDIRSELWSRERETRRKSFGPALCKVRIAPSSGQQWPYPSRVVILTDKPQKPLPASVWQPYSAPVAVSETVSV